MFNYIRCSKCGEISTKCPTKSKDKPCDNCDNSKKIILHLCADVGSDSYQYKKAGYDVRLIGRDIGIENYHATEKIHGIFANPVCTEFSCVKGFDKKGNHEKGMFLVNHSIRIFYEAIKINPKMAFHVLENPGTRNTLKQDKYLGKPYMEYQPFHFGSPWTKLTALWGKFNKPEIIYPKWEDVPKNDKLYIRPGRKKPSLAFFHKSAIHKIREFEPFTDLVTSDMDFRSLASQKFAKAFFDVNR